MAEDRKYRQPIRTCPHCGKVDCQRHRSGGWSSKKNKAARDAAYADAAYRGYRRKVLAAKPPCSYPGCVAVADTLDHVVAVSLGGTNEPGNLRPMCRKHNEALGRSLGNTSRHQLSGG
jgi:5-methylcytosine-specific restriction endonuclease McrA